MLKPLDTSDTPSNRKKEIFQKKLQKAQQETEFAGIGPRSLTMYLLVGLMSFVTDFGIYYLLIRGCKLDPLIANSISRPAGALVCFFVNKYWTFENRGQKSTSTQFIRFWCVFGISLCLSQGLIWLFHDIPIHAKFFAEAIIVLFNYLCLKHWTFK